MLSSNYKQFFNKCFEPFGRMCIAMGLTPNQLTAIGFLLGMGTCGLLVWTRNLLLFAGLMLFCGVFDILDGTVARLSGKVTKFGSYFDAVCDRLLEGFAFLSVAYVTGYWVEIVLILIGSFVISYVKARAAMEVSISNSEWPDLMERAERGLIFLVGLFISEATHLSIAGHDIFYWVLTLLCVLIYWTVIQRILRAKHYIEARQ